MRYSLGGAKFEFLNKHPWKPRSEARATRRAVGLFPTTL